MAEFSVKKIECPLCVREFEYTLDKPTAWCPHCMRTVSTKQETSSVLNEFQPIAPSLNSNLPTGSKESMPGNSNSLTNGETVILNGIVKTSIHADNEKLLLTSKKLQLTRSDGSTEVFKLETIVTFWKFPNSDEFAVDLASGNRVHFVPLDGKAWYAKTVEAANQPDVQALRSSVPVTQSNLGDAKVMQSVKPPMSPLALFLASFGFVNVVFVSLLSGGSPVLVLIGSVPFSIFLFFQIQKIRSGQFETSNVVHSNPQYVDSLHGLLNSTPTQFEELTGQILQRNGILASYKRVGGAGDLGADLIGVNPNGGKIVVQCKRYAPGNKVGSKDIQHFVGMITVHHRADHGVFVTTSSYTPAALQLASEHSHLLTLIDGAMISRLLSNIS